MASKTLRLLLLCFLLHQSQEYGVKLQGKVDLGDDMAVMFQDLLNHYLREESNGHTEVDLGKIMKNFQNIAAKEKFDTVKLVGNNNDKNYDSPKPETKKEKHRKLSKTKKEDNADDNNADTKLKESEEADKKQHQSKREHKGRTKRREKNKNKTKHGKNNEADTKKENDQKSKEAMREKTFLEEIVGAQDNVHVYGKHKHKTTNKPLNNIKA